MKKNAIIYKLQFIRALLKYRSKKYLPSYYLLRSAMKYAPSQDGVISLFGAYVAILSEREDLACGHVLQYFSRRYSRTGNRDIVYANDSERLWVTAFAQYIYLGCIESGRIEPKSARDLRVIHFDQIRFQEIRVLYKKMFPFDHAADIKKTLLRYELL